MNGLSEMFNKLTNPSDIFNSVFQSQRKITIKVQSREMKTNTATYQMRSSISFDDFATDFSSTLSLLCRAPSDEIMISDSLCNTLTLNEIFNGKITTVFCGVGQLYEREAFSGIPISDTTVPKKIPPSPVIFDPNRATISGANQIQFLEMSKLEQHEKKRTGEETFSIEEVRQHKRPADCWGILNGVVYDITRYLEYHPGGKKVLLALGGKDMTSEFNKHHAWVNGERILEHCKLGRVDMPSEKKKTLSIPIKNNPLRTQLCESHRGLKGVSDNSCGIAISLNIPK